MSHANSIAELATKVVEELRKEYAKTLNGDKQTHPHGPVMLLLDKGQEHLDFGKDKGGAKYDPNGRCLLLLHNF
jgi:hypothetical protein